jgi:hypothetical protein
MYLLEIMFVTFIADSQGHVQNSQGTLGVGIALSSKNDCAVKTSSSLPILRQKNMSWIPRDQKPNMTMPAMGQQQLTLLAKRGKRGNFSQVPKLWVSVIWSSVLWDTELKMSAGEGHQQITQLTNRPSSSNELLQDSQSREREKYGHESRRTQK